MQYRMCSDEALKHFRAFTATNTRDRAQARASRSATPKGACDVSGRELKAAIARENLAFDGTGEGTTLDPDTVQLILKLISEVHGEDSTAALMKTLHDKYPGSCGDMPGEDEADLDWPAANAGGAPGPMQDDDDFSIEGQFRNAATDEPPSFPSMPQPGGKMVAQDRALKRTARTTADFLESFPASQRIGGEISVLPKRKKMTAQDAALRMAGGDDYASAFPMTTRIGIA
jgi:hypothetical protein